MQLVPRSYFNVTPDLIRGPAAFVGRSFDALKRSWIPDQATVESDESWIISCDGIEDGDELSDCGDHGEFEGLSLGSQALIEAVQNGVSDLYGAQCAHIGDVPQMFSAA